MKKKVVIEFSEHWLKAVVSSAAGIKQKVEKMIFEPLELDPLSLNAALGRILEKIGSRKGIDFFLCLNRSKITIRQLEMPAKEPGEIEQMLGLHVIRQVPYPKEEIIWSYQNLGFDGVSNSRVLLAIAHRQMLRQIFNSFVAVGILPEAMLMSSQGVIHYLSEELKDKALLAEAHLILDIDDNSSDLILVHNHALRSTVVISQGASLIRSEADLSRLAAELKQALVVFNNEIPNIRPVRLFLTGALFGLEEKLGGYLEKELNLKLQLVKAYSEKVSFSAALGFTYHRKKEDINFNLPEAQIKREIKIKTKQLVMLGILAIYIFVLLSALALVRVSQLEACRDKLNLRIAQLKKDTGGIFEIAQNINIVRQYWGAKHSVITYLYELTSICPDNITLTNFNWEWQKAFTIRGYAFAMADVSGFVTVLERAGIFKGVETRYMRRRKAKDKEGVDFEIAIK